MRRWLIGYVVHQIKYRGANILSEYWWAWLPVIALLLALSVALLSPTTEGVHESPTEALSNP